MPPDQTEEGSNMLRTYSKRLAICILGLFLFGVGNFFGVKAGVAGTNAWNTLALGLAEALGGTFGTGNLIVSLVIITIDLLGKGKLGIGSILNALLIPIFSDLLLTVFSFVPSAPNPYVGALYALIGQTILSFATILYMKPALGCGPRDTLMILIGNRFPRAPIGAAKFTMELGALLVGLLMGAPFGLGTVLVMILQASIFQMACKVTRYEPRSVVHEDFIDTWRKITA